MHYYNNASSIIILVHTNRLTTKLHSVNNIYLEVLYTEMLQTDTDLQV